MYAMELVWKALHFKPEPVEDPRHRTEALLNLWRGALDTIEVRYPDPSVYVETHVEKSWGGIEVQFHLFHLRDTSHPELRLGGFGRNGFITPAYPNSWPGLRVARQYLSAVWAIFLMHEAQELLTFKDTPGNHYRVVQNGIVEERRARLPVVNPHDDYGYNQKLLRGTSDIAATLDVVLGPGNGQREVERYRSRAAQELANEITFVSGQVPRED